MRTLKDYLSRTVGSAGPETLFVCPKDFVLHLNGLFPKANWTHWGVDVGSNAYRECKRVWVISEFHNPRDTLFAQYLGHAELKATEETLRPGANRNSHHMRSLRSLHYRTYLKQMIARGACRNVNEDGVAETMEVHCMIDRERFAELLLVLFPDCQVVYPDSDPFLSRKEPQNRSTVSRLAEFLPSVSMDVTKLTVDDLAENGIRIADSHKRSQLMGAEGIFNAYGWSFIPGRRGRGNGAHMVRTK